MKNYFTLIITAVAIFIISCSDMEKSSFENKPLAVKKETKVAKLKKKKPKIKTTTAGKTKTETTSAKDEDDEEEEKEEPATSPENTTIINILSKKITNYAIQNDLSTEYCFLVDMSLPSGRNRFFIYDLKKNSTINSGLVSHGSCNETFLARPRFSNETKSGCSSLGKYKVGEFYKGKYGKSFRLYGLDDCNSNAYKRAVVIHGYDCVPDKEIYPRVLCNSFGCVMVSYNFFDKISRIISKTEKPIVLWIYQ
ncbi:MAG TPA: murein L,D-transpeptidase catalytic domain family protein [Chitinophagaceae bacterium]|nr:murein L,D-transpeptidase catalytic domain family protein [Chitinophagaceae bacterium]